MCWLPKSSRSRDVDLQFSNSSYEIFPKNTHTHIGDIFYTISYPVISFPEFSRTWGGGGQGGREAGMSQCCRWWIPLWTLSFLAECVQWARARSWNLANETPSIPHPRARGDAIGWQTDRGGNDWSMESRASVTAMVTQTLLTTCVTHHEAAQVKHTLVKKKSAWNIRYRFFTTPCAHTNTFSKIYEFK